MQADIENEVLHISALPDSLFARAKQIAEQTTSTLGPRALDLLHVAAAIELGTESFYSFDDRQRRLAKTLRLKLNRLA